MQETAEKKLDLGPIINGGAPIPHATFVQLHPSMGRHYFQLIKHGQCAARAPYSYEGMKDFMKEPNMITLRLLGAVLAIAAAMTGCMHQMTAESARSLDQDAAAALQSLYEKTPAARALGVQSKGILVFPRIVKAGLVVGGQGGDGVLLKNGRTAGYYNTSGLSVGLQAGAQSFGYALFFMSDSALKYLESSNGWEIGVGPSIVVVDAGAARNLSTTTAQSDIYAFFFDQSGLMAGMGLQGTKITQLER